MVNIKNVFPIQTENLENVIKMDKTIYILTDVLYKLT